MMTKNEKIAHELYAKVMDKDKISEELLYNAICYFENEREKVIDILGKMEFESCQTLEREFADARNSIREALKTTLTSGKFSAPFHDPNIEDILFYQMTHGYPVG